MGRDFEVEMGGRLHHGRRADGNMRQRRAAALATAAEKLDHIGHASWLILPERLIGLCALQWDNAYCMRCIACMRGE